MTDPANPGQSYGSYNPYNPQGGTPYGSQGGNPYSPQGGSNQYNPQGGNPYAPQGGEAPPPPPYGAPSPYGAPPPYGATPPPPQKRGIAGRLLGTLGGLLVVALIIGGVLVFQAIRHKSDTTNAKVNDCIHSEALTSNTAKEVKNTKIVKCDDASANYKVVGVVAGKTEIQFSADDNICSQYPTAESALWQGVSGRTGSVLCLAPNKK